MVRALERDRLVCGGAAGFHFKRCLRVRADECAATIFSRLELLERVIAGWIRRGRCFRGRGRYRFAKFHGQFGADGDLFVMEFEGLEAPLLYGIDRQRPAA